MTETGAPEVAGEKPLPAAPGSIGRGRSAAPSVVPRPAWRRCGVAVLATIVAFALREILGRELVPSVYLTFYLAVLVSALYGGLGPGLVTTVLSAAVGWYFYLRPLVGPRGIDATDEWRILLFVLMSALATWLISRHQRAREALQVAKEELETRVAARTAELAAANTRLEGELRERERVAAALRLSEERFALAVAGSNDGVWDWRIDTNKAYISTRWCEILGFRPESVGDGPEVWVSRIHPDDAERFVGDLTHHLEGRAPLFRCEYRMRHADGTYRWVLSRGLALRDAQGRPYRIAGSLTDITPRRQAEEEVRRRQAEVAHAQRLSTLGEMAAGLAHELNQPLAAIVSYARGCVRRLRRGDARPQDLIEPIEEVASQALRAGAVLQRYRAFVRTGKLRREPARIDELVRDAVEFVAASAAEQGVSVRLDLAAHLPEAIVDGVQIEQVLLNLVRNAMEAMQGCPANEVWIRARAVDEDIEVAVEDTGTGIPAEVGDRIFETFFTTKSEGLGMGLSICRSIIEAHGGRLWSTPNPGGGTTFRFTVPLRPPPEKIAHGEEEGAEAGASPATEGPDPVPLKSRG